MATFPKYADEVFDYGCDWQLPPGDTIVTSTWEVPAGLTKGADTFDATSTTVWLSGGTPGTAYDVFNHVVTADGRHGDGKVRLRILRR
jgi:hypothetical protein